MRKFLLMAVAYIFLATTARSQGNVGIGTNTPNTKLDINGALSARITSVAAAASVTIPDNITLFRLTNTTGGSTTILTLANPKDGQFLTVINEDDNPATLNGYTIPAGTTSRPSSGSFGSVRPRGQVPFDRVPRFMACRPRWPAASWPTRSCCRSSSACGRLCGRAAWRLPARRGCARRSARAPFRQGSP